MQTVSCNTVAYATDSTRRSSQERASQLGQMEKHILGSNLFWIIAWQQNQFTALEIGQTDFLDNWLPSIKLSSIPIRNFLIQI